MEDSYNMATKKFSKKLFEQNDPKARKIAIEYFKKFNIRLEDHPNKYGPDLKAMCKFCFEAGYTLDSCEICGSEDEPWREREFVPPFYVEVEVKRVWKGDEFPWATVQFPERKAKYIYQSDKPVIFFMLNAKCNRAFIVEGRHILKSKLVPVHNMYMRGGDEFFFQVPINKGKFVDV
jgi:hypothetical protein